MLLIFCYIDRTGLQRDSQCTPCLGGYYCPMVGMITPTNLCDPGYYCKQGANISTPQQGKYSINTTDIL